MNSSAATNDSPDAGASRETPLQRALRERTDVLVAERRVLHVAPRGRLHAMLSKVERIDYCCVEPPSGPLEALELPFVADSFDVVICDGEAVGPRRPLLLRELARMLRPGGRALLTPPSGESEASFAVRVARAGFFASRIREGAQPPVFVCVRGEY